MLHDLTQRDFVVADPETPDEGFRFRHALTREAAYESIPKSVRVKLHTAAAERLGLEPLGETRDERIGFHLEQAHHAAVDLGDLDRDAEGLGVRAARTSPPPAARRPAAATCAPPPGSWSAAVLLPAAHPDRPEILADLHDALFFSGEIERSEAPVAELLASLDPDDESPLAERARHQQAMLRFLIAPGATPIDTLRKEVERSIGRLEEAGDEGNLAQALADLATIHWVEGNAAAMLDASERALGHALTCGSRHATAEAAPLIAYALHHGSVPLDEGLARLERTRARLRDDRLARALMRLDEARMLAAVGRSEDAHATVERARTIFADLGQRRWLEMSRAIQAEIARSEGHHEQAEALLRSVHAFFRDQGDANNALDRGRAGGPPLRHGPVRGGRRARERGRARRADRRPRGAGGVAIGSGTDPGGRGDPSTAVWLAEEAVSLADTTDFLLLQAGARRALGEALPAAGRDAEAIAALEHAADRYDAKRATEPASETRRRVTGISSG